MPRHQQVTTCRRGGGPTSKTCTCEHCSLAVCGVCGGAEGTLTTDCPGTKVGYERHQEVFETNLDYTDDRGWHLAHNWAGEPIARRSPRFETTKVSAEPPRADPRAVAAPTIDWARVDRVQNLQHALTLKGIAWVLADRACEARSVALARTEDETASLRGKSELGESERELLARLERDRIDFRLADQRAQKCDDEFRQAARQLVASLEEGRPNSGLPSCDEARGGDTRRDLGPPED